MLSVETFEKAKSYGIDKNSFNIVEEWFNMLISTVSKILWLLLTGAVNVLNNCLIGVC